MRLQSVANPLAFCALYLWSSCVNRSVTVLSEATAGFESMHADGPHRSTLTVKTAARDKKNRELTQFVAEHLQRMEAPGPASSTPMLCRCPGAGPAVAVGSTERNLDGGLPPRCPVQRPQATNSGNKECLHSGTLAIEVDTFLPALTIPGKPSKDIVSITIG